MKYSCNECGKEYNRRPNFCDCGNDTFTEIREESDIVEHQQSIPYTGRVVRAHSQQQYHHHEKVKKEESIIDDEEKTSPFTILFLVVLIVLIAVFVPKFLQQKVNNANDADAQYLDRIMNSIMGDFNPSGITRSGECIVRFEVNEAGWVSKREFTQKADVPAINAKVGYALKKATILEKPPKKYTDVPLRLKVSCSANKSMAECMSGLKIDESALQQNKN